MFNFAFNVTQKELVILFNRVLSTGDHVEITSTNHIVYLAVKKDCYVLYDPMPITIKRNNKSLAKLIKERFFTDEGIQSDYMPMSIHVFSENKEAIKPTQASLFKKLIEKRGKNKRLNQRAWDGATSLYIAAFDNCEPVVRMLASEGCDLNLSNKHLYTPIAIAAQCDNAEIIQLLVKHHADVNKTSQHKNTPLHLAAQYGHMKTIETLVAAKANILLKNKKDETPFLVAVRNHQWPTAAFFL